MEAPGNPDILKLFPLVSRLDPFDLTRKSLATSDIMTLLHVSRPNIWEIWKKKIYYSIHDIMQECSLEQIYKISAPQCLMRWLGFLRTGMELAGKPASKQFLAYWFKMRSST